MKSTIKSSADISLLFSQGKRISTPFITVLAMKRSDRHDHDRNHGRVAFIAGKKLGNAVWRNAAKRRMREICRSNGGPWVGYDVIFLAKSNILKASYSKVHSACASAIEKSELQ